MREVFDIRNVLESDNDDKEGEIQVGEDNWEEDTKKSMRTVTMRRRLNSAPIDISREKKDDEYDILIWSTTAGTKREEEGEEKKEEEN